MSRARRPVVRLCLPLLHFIVMYQTHNSPFPAPRVCATTAKRQSVPRRGQSRGSRSPERTRRVRPHTPAQCRRHCASPQLQSIRALQCSALRLSRAARPPAAPCPLSASTQLPSPNQAPPCTPVRSALSPPRARAAAAAGPVAAGWRDCSSCPPLMSAVAMASAFAASSRQTS